MIKCETVTVVATDEDGDTTTVVVPAYTRTPSDLQILVDRLMEEYLSRSKHTRAEVSLGDFAFFALSKAALEPHTID